MDFITDQEFELSVEILYASTQLKDGDISKLEFIEKYYALYIQYISTILKVRQSYDLIKDVNKIRSFSDNNLEELSRETRLNLILIEEFILEALG